MELLLAWINLLKYGDGLSRQTITAGAENVAVGSSSVGNFGTGTMIPTASLPTVESTGTPSQQPVGNSVGWTKLWEGVLAGQRNVVPIPVYKLEAYRQPSSPNTLAADWPATMQIMRPIPQRFMEPTRLDAYFSHGRRRNYQRKIEVLDFRPFSSHEFFGQLAKRKLCIVIQLPRQILLLPCWEKKPRRMVGLLFPEDYFPFWQWLLEGLQEGLEKSPNHLQGQARYLQWLRTGRTGRDMRKRNSVTGPPLMKSEDKRVVTVEAQGQELLPGIPNEITLYQIATKLPWRALHLLSSVSRGWRQAIRSRQVHDARVHHRLTEQLVVCNHNFPKNFFSELAVSQIALYSMRDGRFYDVPPIPHLGGIPKSCQCISLDGKLYVLGGVKDRTSNLGSKEVYVLDLAGQTRGQRRWRQCGDMRAPRQEFGCGVLGGRIYVFGGTSVMEPVCGSEVYDPTVNAWSPLASMLSSRFRHCVATVGDELVVHGGCSFESKYLDWRERRLIVDRNGFVIDLDGKVVCSMEDALDNYGGDDRIYIDQDEEVMDQGGESIGELGDYYTDALSLEVYHSVKDEWRVVKPFQTDSDAKVFVAHGKYYSMTRDGIQVYDIGKWSWTHLHSCSFPAIGPVDETAVEPIAVLALKDELLAIVRWHRRGGFQHTSPSGSSFLRSRGFGSNLKEIVWEKASDVELYFGSIFYNDTPFIVPIQL